MTTAFKTLIEAVQTALLEAPALAGGRVYVGRDMSTPLDAASDCNITLQTHDGEPFALTDGPTEWAADIDIEVRARGSASSNALAAIDPLLELAYARLSAIAWPAGVTGMAALRGRLDVQEAATPVASWQLSATVTFRTAPGSLALAS